MSSPYGGLDVGYTYTPSDTTFIKLLTDISGSRIDTLDTPSAISIIIKTKTVSSQTYAWIQLSLDAVGVIDDATFKVGENSTVDPVIVRVFFFNKYVAISFNKKWVYCYVFSTNSYNSPVEAKLKNVGASSTTLTNIYRREIYDGRDAIFVDYEADGNSIISSLIQQRAIQVFSTTERNLNFTYQVVNDSIEAAFVSSYDKEEVDNGQLSSDGLVYFRDIDVSISDDTAKQVGFITRLYRMSELDTGAVESVATRQRMALERKSVIAITQRLDPRVEMNDRIDIDTIIIGTNREIIDSFIVENIGILLENGNYSMRLSGRKLDV